MKKSYLSLLIIEQDNKINVLPRLKKSRFFFNGSPTFPKSKLITSNSRTLQGASRLVAPIPIAIGLGEESPGNTERHTS
jgi:hypothetical protein